MTEGIITRWLVNEGDKVELEMPLFEMETDKVTIEVLATVTGTFLKKLKQEGAVVPVGEIIAVIGESGEDISEFLAIEVSSDNEKSFEENTEKYDEKKTFSNTKPEGNRIFATPRANTVSKDKGVSISELNGTGPEGLIIERDVLQFDQPSDVLVTPLAKKIAQISDVKLSEIEGSGARGKITKTDVVNAINLKKTSNNISREEKIIPLSPMRRAISDNMMKSLHSMAQANHRMKVDMSAVIGLRECLKKEGKKVSFTDILVKVVSKALLDFPMLNSTLTPEGILIKNYVNMGLAVAVDNGLIVPVVKDADLMTLEEISTVSLELIQNAKNGSLKPDDYKGGTFTITNLGMFDIDEFTAVINPPESAILAIGKIDNIPVAENNNIVIKPIMMLSLTYDHRIIDGAPAAQFLQRIKQIMQNPYLLI